MSKFRSQQGKTLNVVDILPPDLKDQPMPRNLRRQTEVVDAQFVPVRDERPLQPSSLRCHNDNRKAGVEVVPRRAPIARVEERLKAIPAYLFTGLVVVTFAAVFGLAGGFAFLSPHLTEFGGRRGLDITHVTMTPQDANGMRVLLINGIVENSGQEQQPMPSIRADLLAGDTVLATTLISIPQPVIQGRHSHGFMARVPHPGGKLPDLRLSFAERSASRS